MTILKGALRERVIEAAETAGNPAIADAVFLQWLVAKEGTDAAILHHEEAEEKLLKAHKTHVNEIEQREYDEYVKESENIDRMLERVELGFRTNKSKRKT